MVNSVKVEFISHDKFVAFEDMACVTFKGSAGEFGIMPGHVPLFAEIVQGIISLTPLSGSNIFVYSGSGFLRFLNNVCHVSSPVLFDLASFDRDSLSEMKENAISIISNSSALVTELVLAKRHVTMCECVSEFLGVTI